MLQGTQLVGGRAGIHAHGGSFLSPACNAPSPCSSNIVSDLRLILILVIILKTYLISSVINTQTSVL